MPNDAAIMPPTAPDTVSLGTGEKSIDMDVLWKAIRKLSGENAIAVVRVLCEGGKTFREIQTATGLSVNDLNHALYDMKYLDLIITRGDKKGEKTYHLTSYCVVLLNAIERLQDSLGYLDRKDVFGAHN
jgi:predicted transcriptional regulator